MTDALLERSAALLLYLGATLAIGHGMLGALEGWSRSPSPEPVPARGRWWRHAGAGALLVAPPLLLLAQLQALEMAPAEAMALVGETAWGDGWATLAAASALAAAGVLVPFPRWRALGAPCTALALAVALGGIGHAAADDAWPRMARLLDATHVVAMGGWLGGLALTWGDLARDATAEEALARWQRFSSLALVLAPLTIVSGGGSTLLRLAGAPLSAIAASEYGWLLALKVALAAVTLGVGWRNHRQVRRGARPVAGAVRVELAVTLAVLAVTALLSRSEPPVAP